MTEGRTMSTTTTGLSATHFRVGEEEPDGTTPVFAMLHTEHGTEITLHVAYSADSEAEARRVVALLA